MSTEITAQQDESNEEVQVITHIRGEAMNLPVMKGGSWNRPWRKADFIKLLNDLLEWMDDPEHVWFKDYLIRRRINMNLINKWADQFEDIQDLLQCIKEKQESKFLNGGLKGEFQPNITTFALKAVSGWRDKDESVKNHYQMIIANKDMEMERLRAMSKWVDGHKVVEGQVLGDENEVS